MDLQWSFGRVRIWHRGSKWWSRRTNLDWVSRRVGKASGHSAATTMDTMRSPILRYENIGYVAVHDPILHGGQPKWHQLFEQFAFDSDVLNAVVLFAETRICTSSGNFI